MLLGRSNGMKASLGTFPVQTYFGLRVKQIVIRCSGTRKWSQSYEIDHFCIGFVDHFNVLKFSPQARAMEPQRSLWLHSLMIIF